MLSKKAFKRGKQNEKGDFFYTFYATYNAIF